MAPIMCLNKPVRVNILSSYKKQKQVISWWDFSFSPIHSNETKTRPKQDWKNFSVQASGQGKINFQIIWKKRHNLYKKRQIFFGILD